MVGRAAHRHHVLALADLPPVDLHVLQDQAPGQLHGAVVTQQFLDRGPEEGRVGGQPFHLAAVAQQRQRAVADQPRRGLVARDQKEHARGDQLGSGELLPLVLGLDQSRQEVLAGVPSALRDELICHAALDVREHRPETALDRVAWNENKMVILHLHHQHRPWLNAYCTPCFGRDEHPAFRFYLDLGAADHRSHSPGCLGLVRMAQ